MIRLLVILSAVSTASTDHVPLIIYKLPRSGSSWFVSLLNEIPAVYITEEIITTHSTKHGNILEDGLPYLERALNEPMLRYGYGKDTALPEGGSGWRVIGFTLNPRNALGMDISVLAAHAPTARLVVYLRTNKIKHAVAYLRGKQLKKKCKYNIIKDSCRIPDISTLPLDEFSGAIFDCIAKDAVLLRKAEDLSFAIGSPYYRIFYEELLSDKRAALLRLGKALGLQRPLDNKKISGKYAKSTSDDLKQIIENYASIEVWVKDNVPCLLPHLYERDPGAVQKLLVQAPDCGVLENKTRERMNRLDEKESMSQREVKDKFHRKELQLKRGKRLDHVTKMNNNSPQPRKKNKRKVTNDEYNREVGRVFT